MRRLIRGVPGRFRAGIVLALCAALALSGCGSGPSERGAAAIVGDTRITVEQVQSQLDATLNRVGPENKAELVRGRQLDDVSRNIITQQVLHELLTIAARREGIAIDEAQITDLIDELGGPEAASANTVYDTRTIRQRARDQLIAVELAQRYIPGLAVRVDYTTVETRGAAQRRVEELAAAGAGARNAIETDIENGAIAELDAEIPAASNLQFAADPMFGVRPGTVVGFQPQGDNTQPWYIMIVTGRSAEPTDPAEAVGELDPGVLEDVGLRQVMLIAEEIGVRISPRYGVWDPVGRLVAPDENETGGFVAPLRPTPRA